MAKETVHEDYRVPNMKVVTGQYVTEAAHANAETRLRDFVGMARIGINTFDDLKSHVIPYGKDVKTLLLKRGEYHFHNFRATNKTYEPEYYPWDQQPWTLRAHSLALPWFNPARLSAVSLLDTIAIAFVDHGEVLKLTIPTVKDINNVKADTLMNVVQASITELGEEFPIYPGYNADDPEAQQLFTEIFQEGVKRILDTPHEKLIFPS